MTIAYSGDSITYPDNSVQNTAPKVGMVNRIINGAMVIDQRNAGASVAITTVNQYTVDRFAGQIVGTGTGRFTLQQSTTTPASGFKNSLAATVTTTDSSPAAGYGYAIFQKIEGNNVADLNFGSANASTVTLSFSVRSSLTGTFGVVLQNSALTRAYGATYTISSANTWEQKSITITGDTTGTWATDNNSGIDVAFSLGGGSSRTVSTGWQSNGGSYQTNVTGAVSVVGTSGATFYITGVQLEKGSTATSFDYRPYGTELALCQRYYYRLKSEATGTRLGSLFCDSTTVATALVTFPTSMRTRPTSLEQSGTAADYTVIAGGVNPACNAVPTASVSTIDCAAVALTVASGLTTGFGGQIRAANANAYLGWSAEL